MKRNGKRLFCLFLAAILAAAAMSFGAPALAANDDVFSMTTHALAVKTDGTLWAFGFNNNGQLGDGTMNDRETPVKVMDGVASASARGLSSFAVKNDGTLWAWGWNVNGQLGDGTRGNRGEPVKVLSGVAAVSGGGNFTLARKTDGTLWSWGYGPSGELGDGGAVIIRDTPKQIMSGVIAISAGSNHGAALKTDGSLWTWGGNSYGQLGDGTYLGRGAPAKVMDGVAAVSAGAMYTLAIKTDGSLWAWGSNAYGQLGDGSVLNRRAPVKIMDSVTAAAASAAHSLAVKADGSLWAWGNNSYGQLGDGSITNRNAPVKIMDKTADVWAGSIFSLAVGTDGNLWAWGGNDHGQLGNGGKQSSTVPVKVMTGVKCFSAAQVSPSSPLNGLSDWAKEPVTALYDLGLIPADLLQKYQTPIRRDEFVALLVNLYEMARGPVPTFSSPFTDIAGSKYKTQIEKAKTIGLADGTAADKFTPGGLLTREQAAKLLCTTLDVIRHTQANGNAATLTFADEAQISDWAAPYVAACQKEGLMLGVSNNRFDPQGTLTREMALTVAGRMVMNFGLV